jgi:hypothetical protein
MIKISLAFACHPVKGTTIARSVSEGCQWHHCVRTAAIDEIPMIFPGIPIAHNKWKQK